jgi:hypothetical protein
MPRFLAAAVAVVFLASAAHAEFIFWSYAFAKQYKVTISEEALKKSPAWQSDAENPPLSARKAIKLANEMKDSLVQDSKGYKWELQSASLEPADDDKWYWLINYEAHKPGLSNRRPDNLRVAVLMDGTVVKPEVKDNK